MFPFPDEDEDNAEQLQPASQRRFYKRIQKFKDRNKFMPRTQHYFWWFVHNAVAHIFLATMPIKQSFQFHDWTSRKLNAE